MTVLLVILSMLLTGAFVLFGDLKALGVALIVVLLAQLSQASDHHRDLKATPKTEPPATT